MRKTRLPELDIRFGEKAPEKTLCAHEGCSEEGRFPAPRSTADLRDYIWFCLAHVRDYNKRWNYYQGLNEAEMEAAIRRQTTWERPSWKFGTGPSARNGSFNPHQARLDDPFDFLGQDNCRTESSPQHQLSAEQRQAWKTFGLSPTRDISTVKERYKTLAKQHHPDANGGSKQAEEQLKEINQAYTVLKKQLAG